MQADYHNKQTKYSQEEGYTIQNYISECQLYLRNRHYDIIYNNIKLNIFNFENLMRNNWHNMYYDGNNTT